MVSVILPTYNERENVRILINSTLLEDVNIGIKGDRIVFISKQFSKAASVNQVIDGDRCIALPGFIDLHVHIFSPGWIKEDYRTGTSAAAVGGYTLVCDMASVNKIAV